MVRILLADQLFQEAQQEKTSSSGKDYGLIGIYVTNQNAFLPIDMKEHKTLLNCV